jgi:DNA-binding SARP family transcriptional activator
MVIYNNISCRYILRGETMKLYICTLGEFDIKADGKSLLKDSSRMYKIYRLFEYFLTFRNKKLLPETIIDNLLSDSESDDPKNMLRTQIFRLRKVISSVIPEGEDGEQYLNLSFTNGYYCLEFGENTEIDIDRFESFIQQGEIELQKNNIGEAADCFQKAISLYKGLYLSDNAYEVWLVPTRNYYQRLYLKTLFRLLDLLKKNDKNERIVTLCEEALLIEPFEENIHIELMDDLLRMGQNKTALNHYEYALNMLEKEFDAKPSQRFTVFLQKIHNTSLQKNDLNINIINKNFEEESPMGAMYCSIDYFKFLFNIQKRKCLRNNENDYLCIITINRGSDDYRESGLKKGIDDVFPVLEKSLRKGDVFTSWNHNQVLVLLHDVRENGTEVIKERLTENLRDYTKINKSEISMIFQPLLSENTSL